MKTASCYYLTLNSDEHVKGTLVKLSCRDKDHRYAVTQIIDRHDDASLYIGSLLRQLNKKLNAK